MKSNVSNRLSKQLGALGFIAVDKFQYSRRLSDIELLIEFRSKGHIGSKSRTWIPRFSIYDQRAMECFCAYRPVLRGTGLGLLFGNMHFVPGSNVPQTMEQTASDQPDSMLDAVEVAVENHLIPFVVRISKYREIAEYLLATTDVQDRLYPPQAHRKPIAGILLSLAGNTSRGLGLISEACEEVREPQLKELFRGIPARISERLNESPN